MSQNKNELNEGKHITDEDVSDCQLKQMEKKSMKSIRDEKYSSDSFERFGDDLCELLLSYLSVKQKKRFECVSKQWQRLVYNKQKILFINRYEESIDSIIIPNNYRDYNNVFHTLFKKFKFINDLNIRFDINDNELQIITDNCIDLKKVVLNGDLSEKKLTDFGLKFGKSLEFVNINANKYQKLLLPFTKNIRIISIDSREMFDVNSLFDSYLPKLEEIIDLCVYSLNDFIVFTDKYCKQIKKISLRFKAYNNDKHENVSFNQILIQLSRYQNIESLGLHRHETKETIDNELMIISNNCKKLKSILCDFRCTTVNFCSRKTLFEIFGAFHALEKLRVELWDANVSIGNIKSLEKCKNLKSLELKLSKHLTDDNLNCIHLCLPKLKSILLTSLITDKTLQNLSKIQNLSKFIINSPKISVSGVCDLIKNSPNIKRLDVNFPIYTNKKTIEAFTERANNNHKILFKFNPHQDYKILVPKYERRGIYNNLLSNTVWIK